MAERSRFFAAMSFAIVVCAVAFVLAIGTAASTRAPRGTDHVKEATAYLREYRATKAVAPVDCEALYELIQAAQSVYLEQCPGP